MKKIAEINPSQLLTLISNNQITNKHRIIWRKNNIIYLASTITIDYTITSDNLPELFEIWAPEIEN